MGFSRCIALKFSQFSSRSGFKFGCIPLKQRSYMKQNLLQLFSSITFTQHFRYCCPKEEPRGCSVTRNTFIISQSEKTGSYRVISWVKSEKAKHPWAQRMADVTLTTLAGLLRSREAHQGAVLIRGAVTATQSPAPVTSLVTLSYFSGSKHYQNAFLPQRGTRGWTGASRSTRTKRGCTNQSSQADPSPQPTKALQLLHALKSSQHKPQECWLRTESASPIHGSWKLSYSTTNSTRPSNPPASPSLF